MNVKLQVRWNNFKWEMENLWDTWGGFLIVLSALITALFLSSFVINIIMGMSCDRQAEVMQVDYHYSFLTGCMYELNGDFIPSNQYFIIKNMEVNK